MQIDSHIHHNIQQLLKAMWIKWIGIIHFMCDLPMYLYIASLKMGAKKIIFSSDIQCHESKAELKLL